MAALPPTTTRRTSAKAGTTRGATTRTPSTRTATTKRPTAKPVGRTTARPTARSSARSTAGTKIPGAGARGAGSAGRARAAGSRQATAGRTATAPRKATAGRTATAPRKATAGRRTAASRRTSTSRRPAPTTTRRVRRGPQLGLRLRLAIPYFLVVALALVLAGRVIWVGVVQSDTYAELGLVKRERVLALHELRGTIFDRNGEALVMSVPSKLVAVDPTIVDDPEATATRIAEILGIDRLVVLDALEKPDTRYSVIARQVDAALAEQLQDAGIRGLTFSEDPQRVSNNGELARSITGSMDKYATTARSGIELLYDKQLRPTEGREEVQQGVRGSTIPGSERVIRQARAGSDVTLTIDRALQFLAEAELSKQVEAVHAKGGTVVLGRPATGEILAMASVARTPEGQVVQGSLNQAIRLYEPGSIMKLVTVAAAYDEGLVTPDSTMTVEDSITLYDKTIEDSHDHDPELMSVNQILSESSNVGTIKIAQLLEANGGIESIVDYLTSFGFGNYTALGLPKEQKGDVKKPTDWNGTDIGSIPIGQSVTVSPVQMWTAYNTIANDGMYIAPRLVRDVVDAEGRHGAPVPPKPHRVVSAKAADMVTESLEDVVEEGTGKEFKIPGFNIAAKTGTAYKVQDNGTYGTAANRKYAASFVGFFPASNPQISIMVMIDEPGYGQHFGATAAGPVFDALARESMRRFSIAGDTDVKPQPGELIRSQPAPAPTTTTTTTTTIPVPVDPNAPVDPNVPVTAPVSAPIPTPTPVPTATVPDG